MKTWADFGIVITGEFSGEKRVLCPECSSERKKSQEKCLACNGDTGTWFCHHCNWAGSLGGEDWKPKEYAKPATPPSDIPDKALKWFLGRGISRETLEYSRVSYGETYMPQQEKNVGVIQFVYYRGDEVVNIKYRDAKKNFKQVTGAEKIVYGYNDVLNKKEIIIVEGEMDKLSMVEAGHYGCFSVPDGAPSPTAHNYTSKFTYLESISEVLQEASKIILMVDADPPGKKLEGELARRIGKEKCWQIVYPKGCKDANDILTKHGKEAVSETIKNARPFPVDGLFGIEDISEAVLNLYDVGLKRGTTTGWEGVDKLYTVRRCEWTVVTGIPGHGKSEFVDNLVINLTMTQGWRIAMFSPENLPIERHCAKLVEKYTRMPFVDGFTERIKKKDLEEAMSFLKGNISFIMPPEDEMNLDKILELARVAVYRDGIQGLVIDPWNEIDHARPSGMTETEYISQALSRIRRFVRYYDLHIWVVAHPVKLFKDSSGKYPVPTPYDISGSAHWRNKADNALAIFRDMENDNAYLHVQKIRFREVGRVGMAPLQYNKVNGIYTDRSTNGELPF